MLTIITISLISSLRNLFDQAIYIVVIALPCVFLVLYCPNFLNKMILGMSRHIILLCCIRWITIIVVALFWKHIVKKFGNYYQVSDETIFYWQEKHLHIVVWLIIFELLVCENIIVKLIHLI